MTSQQDTELKDTQDLELETILYAMAEDLKRGFVHSSVITTKQALTSWKDKEVEITENTSDGYHTFKELYEFRMLYNAAYFNELAREPYTGVCKSWRHADGEKCFGGGWFVVTAQLPTGQITNHYEAKDWDLFQIPEVDKAPEWDGHTAQDVAKRLRESLQSQGGKNE